MNVWSGGDYSNNTNGLFSSSNITTSVSSDWASIGDKSFLAVVTGEVIADLLRLGAGTFDSGTYLLKMDVYNLADSFKISLFNGSDNYQRVTIPASTEVTQVEITLTADNAGYLSIRSSTTNGAKFYFDNISITPTATPSTP